MQMMMTTMTRYYRRETKAADPLAEFELGCRELQCAVRVRHTPARGSVNQSYQGMDTRSVTHLITIPVARVTVVVWVYFNWKSSGHTARRPRLYASGRL